MPDCTIILRGYEALEDSPEHAIERGYKYYTSEVPVGGVYLIGRKYIEPGNFSCGEFCPTSEAKLVCEWLEGPEPIGCTEDLSVPGPFSTSNSGGSPCYYRHIHTTVPPDVGGIPDVPGIATFARVSSGFLGTVRPRRSLTKIWIDQNQDGSCSLRASLQSGSLRVYSGSPDTCADGPQPILLTTSTPPFDIPCVACCGTNPVVQGWGLRINNILPPVSGSGENPLKGYGLLRVPYCGGPADVPRGACCDQETGACTENLTEAECLESAPQTYWGGEGSNCADIQPPCEAIPQPGACFQQLFTASTCEGVIVPGGTPIVGNIGELVQYGPFTLNSSGGAIKSWVSAQGCGIGFACIDVDVRSGPSPDFLCEALSNTFQDYGAGDFVRWYTSDSANGGCQPKIWKVADIAGEVLIAPVCVAVFEGGSQTQEMPDTDGWTIVLSNFA